MTDETEGDRLKREGMARAVEAVPVWSDEAREAVEWLARRGEPFTSDDVVALVGLPRESSPNSNNAVGGVIAGAARRGLIRRVSDTTAGRWRSHSRRLAVWVGVLTALVALSGPASGTPAHRDRRTVEASLNVYRGNPSWAIRHDVRAAMARADLIRIQEAYGRRPWAAVRAEVHAHPAWRLTRRAYGTELPILWNTREWWSAGAGHVALIYPRTGPEVERWISWKPLLHLGSHRIVTVANVHPLPGYCQRRTPLRDELARRHWTRVARWSVAHSAHPVLLGGDFNCSLRARGRPWFPGVILRPLYRIPRAFPGVDHLLTSRTPGHPVTVRRWRLPALSDHPLVLRKVRWTP